MLNAKQHEREAAIIAMAGAKASVTVATNMAGRGTDIILGGNPEFLADKKLHDQGIDALENSEEYEDAVPGAACASSRRRRPSSTRRSSSSAGCMWSAPSGTSPAGSTTSYAVGRAARATRGRAVSISPWATT